MKISKQARRDAKHLFLTCRTNGVLEDAKVRTAVTQVIAQKPRGYQGILAQFQRLVKLDIARRSATVESAVALTPAQQQSIAANLATKHGAGLDLVFTLNPDLIGGLRIKVGSDVYDGSVQGRLAALESNL